MKMRYSIGAIVLLLLGLALYSKYYEMSTPEAVKAAHQAMAKELLTLQYGDFVQFNGGKNLAVCIRVDGEQIDLIYFRACTSDKHYISVFAREVTLITRRDSPNWPLVARRFLGIE